MPTYTMNKTNKKLNKGHISSLKNKGLLVGSNGEEAPINLRVIAHRNDKSKLTSKKAMPLENYSNPENRFHGVIKGFSGDQVTSFEAGAGTAGVHWEENTLDPNITGIKVANGASGTIGIKIALKDIQTGHPVIVTSGALSGCIMVYAVKDGYFFAYHTGQKPGDDRWKTGQDGAGDTIKSHQALLSFTDNIPNNEDNIPNNKDNIPNNKDNIPNNKDNIPNNKDNIPNNKDNIPNNKDNIPNNKLVDVFAECDQSVITYLGKPGVEIDSKTENVSVFDYNKAKPKRKHIIARIGYSYALLARDDKGKVKVKVLSEDTLVLGNSTIKVINSLKKRLL
ncbi:cytotoxic necrotizing factor Rho-activating domain-containing protein [Photorhabdus tasmaniensis]